MLEQRLTTEFYEDTLPVVIFDTVGCFSEPLSTELIAKNIEVIQLPLSNLENPQITTVLEQAYKIILVLSPALIPKNIADSLTQLQSVQDKLSIFMPVLSGFSEQVSGEIPYAAVLLQSQRELITLCNELLPQANFIFGQDVLLPVGFFSSFELFCQSIQKGFIYTPNTLITPHTLPEFCSVAVQELLRPHRVSVSIKGRTKYAQKLLEKVATQYESFYFCEVGLQKVDAVEEETIPFTVKDVSILTDEDSTTLWFSKQLPSPELPTFFLPERLSILSANDDSTDSYTSDLYTPENLDHYAELPPLPLYEPDTFEPWAETDIGYAPGETRSNNARPNTARTEATSTLSISQVITLEQGAAQTHSDERYSTSRLGSSEMLDFDYSSDTQSSDLASSRRNRPLQLTNLHTLTEKNFMDTSEPKLAESRQADIVDEFNVSSEIQRIFTSRRQEQQSERVSQLVQEKRMLTKKSKKKTTLFYGGLAFVSVGGFVGLLLLIFVGSTWILKQQVFGILQAPLSEITQGQLQRAEFTSSLVAWQAGVYSKVIEVPQIEESKRLVSVEQQLSTLHNPESQSAESVKKLYTTVMGTSTGDVAQLTENISSQTLTTYEAASIVEQSLQQISFPDESVATELTAAYQKKVSQLKKQAFVMQQLQPILGKILGLSGKRTYALVLQNNQELRPTGGFMDAIAVVTVENGTMVDRQVYTSYELDKKMAGTVAAPAEITKALGQKTFSIYDANWSPDYPTSAATVEWFLEKILNRNIDGVLSVDLYGMQRILEATGPIELPEYNEVITNKNLLERLEFHSEVVLLETEKNHDYRKVLFSRLLDKLVQLPSQKVDAVMGAVEDSFAAKSTLLAFSDTQEKQIIQNIGWSGAQIVPRCPSEFSSATCVMDHFMQVEANVGVNKANYYLKRTIKHSISVSPTQADHTQLVTFENTAQLDAWPKGSYRSYVRFYLPSSAVNIRVQIGTQVIPDSQINRTQENDFTSVGFLLEVPIKSSNQVTLTYSTPLQISGDRFSYVFFNNEQPGNGDSPYSLQLTYTGGLVPQVVAPQAEITPAGITFTRNNDESSLYAVEFTQAK